MNHYLNAQEILGGLLASTAPSMEVFNKKTYKASFERIYQSLVPAFDSIEELYKTVGEPQQMLGNMAQAVTDQAKEKYDACKRKSEREATMMNLNMQLAVFIFPAILQYHGESSKPFAQALSDKWKEVFPKSNVAMAEFESIEQGFHKKFCYITTAVCENTGRRDDCYELELLRDYRDGYLAELENGPQLIASYYDVAPSIVKHLDQRPDREALYRDIWENHISPCISLIEQGEKEACAVRYGEMVEQLKERYFYTEYTA